MSESTFVVQITCDGMGHANVALRHKLIGGYLELLGDSDPLPDAIAFYTDGVKLAAQGSPVVEQLRDLESRGVHLILCTTCLEHFGLADQVAVGTPGGMMDIVAMQKAADKVVTL